MFKVPGAIGIGFIGIIGGYYFGRFFENSPGITAPQLVSLLTLLGVGPTALILVQNYLKLSLLDPYGIGLAVGIFLNFSARGIMAYLNWKRQTSGAPGVDAERRNGTAKYIFAQAITSTASAAPTLTVRVLPRVGLVFDKRPETDGLIVPVYEVIPSTAAPTSSVPKMWVESNTASRSSDEQSTRWLLICGSLDELKRARQYEATSNHHSIAEAVTAAQSGLWIEADPEYVTRLLS